MSKFILFSLLLLFLVSCKSTRNIIEIRNIPNISEGKLYKNIDENRLDFNTLYSKKVDISLVHGKKKDNITGTLRIARDSFIWASFTAPLGIELGRILMTRDSVKYLDIYNKQYLLTNYDYFYEKFGFELSFDCLQNILTNNFFNPEICMGEEQAEIKYKFEKNKTGYLLSNIHKRAVDRKIRKFYKKKRKNKEFSLILQEIDIHPEVFRPERVMLKDMDDHVEFSVSYKNFKEYGDMLFPEIVSLSLLTEDNKFTINLKFTRLEFETKVVPNFRISPKFKEMKK